MAEPHVLVVPAPPPWLCAHAQGCDHITLVPSTSGGNEALTITWHLAAAKGQSERRGYRNPDGINGQGRVLPD